MLQCLLENRLFVKAEKCVFHASSVSFLGPVVSADGIIPLWIGLSPTLVLLIQGFLGLLIFIVALSVISARWPPLLRPLTLTKSCFTWSDAAQETFDRLKELFTSAPILITSDTSRQFIVEFDVSNVGVGAGLSQCFPQDDRVHPCAFFSHPLSPAKRNDTVGNRELLVIRLASGFTG